MSLFLSIFRMHRPVMILILAWLLFGFADPASAQTLPADYNDDGKVDYADLIYLQHQWMMQERGADLDENRQVNEKDLLELLAQWHQKGAIQNPYTRGRAVGIRAVTQLEDQTLSSGELEVRILGAPGAPNQKPALMIAPIERRPVLKVFPSEVQSPALPAGNIRMLEPDAVRALAETVAQLTGCAETLQGVALSGSSLTFGSPVDRIGTFDGWSVWIGWSGSFSETYSPEGESYSWVIHFAPEGVYVSLQKAEFIYSSVDVFAGISAFMGGLVSPDGDIVTRQYINDLLGINFSVSMSTKLIPVVSLWAPGLGMNTGLNFYRRDNTDLLVRAIGFSAGYSISFELLPVGMPFSVSLDTKASVEAGFYPIIGWQLEHTEGENPMNTIHGGLQALAAHSGTQLVDLLGVQFARILQPTFSSLRTSGTVGHPPANFGQYIAYFMQDNSVTVPSGSPEGSIDDLIKRVEVWKQSGQTNQLPEALQVGLPFSRQLMIEEMKPIQAATQVGFEIGYKHGCDANPNCKDQYADCVETVYCPVGEWCTLVVTAQEIAALVPGSHPGDFEGVPVYFDTDPVTYFNTQGTQIEVPVENGEAVYEFVMQSNVPLVIGVKIYAADIPQVGHSLELCRRVVKPPAGVGFYSNDKVYSGSSLTLNAAVQESGGSLTQGKALVRFYDYRDHLLGAPVPAKDGLATLTFIPRPSIPHIRQFVITKIGYSEEDARNGYSLTGIGFSQDADVLFNGVSIGEMTDWLWQINSSREILFLPPDDDSLFTEATNVQVINPDNVSGNVYVYQPRE